MDISGFQIHSQGVALENKQLSSKKLRVVPMEQVPFLEGEVAENDQTITVSGVDRFGNSYTTSATSTNAITAEWIPLGSNRATAPDVRRGERIVLFRYMNTDQYFWVTDGRDEHLRRLETVIYRYSNTREEGEVTITDDNSWSLTISTHEKHITLRTTKSDGEPFAYTFQINAKDGIVILQDDAENFIELNSKDTFIKIHNAENTYIEMDKKIMNIHALDQINLKTKEWNVETETTNYKSTNINTEATAIVIKTDTNDTTASTNTITATTTHNGAVNITGAVTMGAGFSASGGGSIEGSLSNNGVDVGSSHVHPKGPTSQPDTNPPKP